MYVINERPKLPKGLNIMTKSKIPLQFSLLTYKCEIYKTLNIHRKQKLLIDYNKKNTSREGLGHLYSVYIGLCDDTWKELS